VKTENYVRFLPLPFATANNNNKKKKSCTKYHRAEPYARFPSSALSVSDDQSPRPFDHRFVLYATIQISIIDCNTETTDLLSVPHPLVSINDRDQTLTKIPHDN